MQQKTEKFSIRDILIPLAFIVLSICANAIFPLKDLWYHESLTRALGSWVFWPTTLFFPGQELVPNEQIRYYIITLPPINLIVAWIETLGLFLLLALICGLYVLVLRRLANRISLKMMLALTVLIALPWIFTGVLPSSDVFSYIAYARIGVIYHLNPLTNVPIAIKHDAIYQYLYWKAQPSAYGPTWVLLTCGLQLLLLALGNSQVIGMLIALKVFALMMHLGSTLLLWIIIGRLQQIFNLAQPGLRSLLVLAFAWNPLLIFESTLNAHNDTTLLFLLLLTLWFFVRNQSRYDLLFAAIAFALTVCLKVYCLILLPGFLFYLWAQNSRKVRQIAILGAGFLVTCLLLYGPFWNNGKILNVITVNPAASRNINNPLELISQVVNSILKDFGLPTELFGSTTFENILHTLSLLAFVVLYALFCWRSYKNLDTTRSFVGLLRWLTFAWLFYCLLGATWFWPWYTTIFFGLFALLQSCLEAKPVSPSASTLERIWLIWQPNVNYAWTFTLLTSYVFYASAPQFTFIPGLVGFQIAFFRGLWIWSLPGLTLYRNYRQLKAGQHSPEAIAARERVEIA